MNQKTKKLRITAAAALASAAAFSLSTRNLPSVDRRLLKRLHSGRRALLTNADLSEKQCLNPTHPPHYLVLEEDLSSMSRWDSDSSSFSFMEGSSTSTVVPRQQHEPAVTDSIGSSLRMSVSMSDEQRQFEMHVGKAIDTLRNDYPDMLSKCPDFSIYDPQIEVVDPSGVKLHNLSNYKTSFQFLHAIITFFYCPEKSSLTFRIHYDGARRNIRVSWNVLLVPRRIYGGIRNRLYVDGISVYEIHSKTGLITQHRVERLLINDAPVQAPQGIFLAIAREAMEGPEGIPVLSIEGWDHAILKSTRSTNIFRSEFRTMDPFQSLTTQSTSLLFSSPEIDEDNMTEQDDLVHPLFDQEAYDKKNASRKKFGLPPITPLEYIEIQAKVEAMDTEQREKASAIASNAAEMTKEKRKDNFLGKFFGRALENTCESNFDCERPEICCDFGFVRKCCRNGVPVYNGAPKHMQPKLVPVYAGDPFPRGGPEGVENY